MSTPFPVGSPEREEALRLFRGGKARTSSEAAQDRSGSPLTSKGTPSTPNVSARSEGILEPRVIVLPVCPMGKPRQTQRDKWKKRPVVLRYRAFCDAVRAHWPTDLDFPEAFAVTFRLPIPKSRRLLTEDEPHRQRPDVDNMVKALLDALLPEDSAVHTVHASKRWTRGAGSITITPLS